MSSSLVLKRWVGLAAAAAWLLAACGQAATPAPTAVSVAPTAVPAAATALPASEPTAVPPTAPPPTATAVPEPYWSSWSAGDQIYTLAVAGDQLIAGGPGGVSVWRSADGGLVRRYITGDGLPSAYVNGVLPEADGSLWVATNGGLTRFSGDEAATFTRLDGLDSDNVVVVTRIQDEVWAGTYYSGVEGGGLMRLQNGAWQPVRGFPSANQDERPGRLSYNVNAILTDSAGALWVSTTNGLGRFDGQAWTRFSTAEGLPSNRLTGVFLDRGGQIWATTEAGAARFDGQGFVTFRQLQGVLGGGVYGFTQDADGRYWFAGPGGLLRFNPANGDWERFDQQAYDLPAATLTRAVRGEDGALFFGSDGGGLVRFADDNFTTWVGPDGPSFGGLRRIVPDRATNTLLFVEEGWIRADRYDPASGAWARVPDLPCDGCAPLASDAQGALWAGSDRGLWVIADADVTQWTTEFGLPGNSVNAVALAGPGQAWVGTNGGVAFIDGSTVTQTYTDSVGLAGNYIRQVFLASDGALWAATETNLSRRAPDGTWQHFTAGDPFNYAVPVNDLAEAPDGAIWVATSGDGVYRYADGAWQAYQPNDPGVKLPSGYVTSVALASDGSLWFGTDAGAARFADGAWSVFRVQDGLLSARVLDVYADEAGALWFATGGGAARYGP